MKRDLRVLAALMILPLLGGCAQYDMSDDLHDEFNAMVANYRSETDKYEQQTSGQTYKAADLPAVPGEFKPPGEELQAQGVDPAATLQKCSLDDLYIRALEHSSQIRVFSDVPLIRQTGIQEAKGDFDTHAFVESSYDKTDEPAGSILITGGASRLIEDDTGVDGGLKKKFVTGTEVTLDQRVDHLDSNSIYLSPNPQNTASLSLTIEQPLLKGAGVAYNEATMRVAEIDSEVAKQEFIRQSESHLLEITRAYWGLYLARSLYFVKKQLADETDKIVKDLEARTDVDSVKRQILRARAASAERNADLVRSEAAIRNAQDRLVALINDPALEQVSNLEILPKSEPVSLPMPADVRDAALVALKTRPEISQGFFQLKSAAIREKMERNEILPTLDFIVQGTLSGLYGTQANDAGQAYENQFGVGGPGYMVGIKGDMPLENNAAEARLKRRRLELRQQFDQVQTTIETVLLEVKVSVREVQTSYRDLQAKYASYQAAKEEIDDLHARKDFMLGSKDVTAPTYFEYLLEAQNRYVQADSDYFNSLATYNVAIVNLQKAQGTLLSYQNISIQKGKDPHGLPQLHLAKETTAASENSEEPAASASVLHGAPTAAGDAAVANPQLAGTATNPPPPLPAAQDVAAAGAAKLDLQLGPTNAPTPAASAQAAAAPSPEAPAQP